MIGFPPLKLREAARFGEAWEVPLDPWAQEPWVLPEKNLLSLDFTDPGEGIPLSLSYIAVKQGSLFKHLALSLFTGVDEVIEKYDLSTPRGEGIMDYELVLTPLNPSVCWHPSSFLKDWWGVRPRFDLRPDVPLSIAILGRVPDDALTVFKQVERALVNGWMHFHCCGDAVKASRNRLFVGTIVEFLDREVGKEQKSR